MGLSRPNTARQVGLGSGLCLIRTYLPGAVLVKDNPVSVCYGVDPAMLAKKRPPGCHSSFGKVSAVERRGLAKYERVAKQGTGESV